MKTAKEEEEDGDITPLLLLKREPFFSVAVRLSKKTLANPTVVQEEPNVLAIAPEASKHVLRHFWTFSKKK